MQVRNLSIVITLFVFFFTVGTIQAQRVVTNQDGEKIILYDDGSWRYYEPDSAATVSVDTADYPEALAPVSKKKNKKKTKKSKTKKQKTKKQKNKKNKSGKNKKDNSKKAKKKKQPKTKASPREEAMARREALLYSQRKSREERLVLEEYTDVQRERITMENRLKASATDINTDVDEIITMEEKLTKLKRKETQLKYKYKEAKKQSKKANKMIKMSKAKRDKKMAKLMKKQGGTSNKKDDQKNNDNKKQKSSEKEVVVDWRSRTNVIMKPPNPDCIIVNEEVDDFTGRTRRDLQPEVLFTHTSDQLKSYFKEEDYITAEANLSGLDGGIIYLTLELTIASDLAQREFGVLEKGSPLTIKFINGGTVRLQNSRTDIGQVDKVNRQTKYTGRFTIGANQAKELSKNEIDKIRVVWGTGYEDYEAYKLDFFADQLRCLGTK